MGALDRKQVQVKAHLYNPETDSYFVHGRVAGRGSPRPFFTGWISRHRPDRVYSVRRFMDKDSALLSYKETQNEQKLSAHRSLTKDWQQNRVYEWEGTFVYPHGHKVNKKDVRKLIKQVCADYNLEEPKLIWEKHTDNSWVFTEDNELHFGHRDNIGVLHEMAHLVHDSRRDTEQPVTHHSPAFVWTVIELYARYTDLGLYYLSTSAANAGVLGNLAVNDNPVRQKLRKPNGP